MMDCALWVRPYILVRRQKLKMNHNRHLVRVGEFVALFLTVLACKDRAEKLFSGLW